jgi:hypothetical protein
MGFALEQPQFPKVVDVEIEQVQGHHHDLGRGTLQFVLKDRKVCPAVGCRSHDLATDDGRACVDVPSVVGDLLEMFRPVVAATGEDFDRFIHKMDLNAIPVEFDLVNPALTAGTFSIEVARADSLKPG